MTLCQHPLKLENSPHLFGRRLIIGRRPFCGRSLCQVFVGRLRDLAVCRPWVNLRRQCHAVEARRGYSALYQHDRGQRRTVLFPGKLDVHLCVHGRTRPQVRSIENYPLVEKF